MNKLEDSVRFVLRNFPFLEKKDFDGLKRRLEEETHANIDDASWKEILRSSAERITNNVLSSIRKIEGSINIYDELGDYEKSSKIRDSLSRYYQSLM